MRVDKSTKGGRNVKKEILNGILIPHDLPTEELDKMMSSPIMQDFSLACEALSYKNDPEAYRIMKFHIDNKDKYRRLYVLKTIFRHPEAVELIDYIEKAIASDDFLFIENGLLIVSEYDIKVSESLLVSVVKKYCDRLYTAVGALKTLEKNNENFERIVEVFTLCAKCAQRETLSELLCDKYLPEKSKELFGLFSKDTFASVRLIGVKIGKQYGFDTSNFLLDVDGHVRKAAE